MTSNTLSDITQSVKWQRHNQGALHSNEASVAIHTGVIAVQAASSAAPLVSQNTVSGRELKGSLRYH